jgi:hypothetical protein
MSGLGQAARALAAAAVLAAAGPAGAQGERAEPAEGPARTNDFDRVNPGIGFGWFGFSDLPIGDLGGGQGDTLSAPVVGIRWWMGAPLGPFRAWGVDLGLGLVRESSEEGGVDTTRTGLLLHAGLPLVVSATRHVAIEFVPELNLGFAAGDVQGGRDVSGTRVDVGARAGAEVFFGFVGLPQLSLEASVGLFIAAERRTEQDPGQAEVQRHRTTFGTTVHEQPWDVFRGDVAARYYF